MKLIKILKKNKKKTKFNLFKIKKKIKIINRNIINLIKNYIKNNKTNYFPLIYFKFLKRK